MFSIKQIWENQLKLSRKKAKMSCTWCSRTGPPLKIWIISWIFTRNSPSRVLIKIWNRALETGSMSYRRNLFYLMPQTNWSNSNVKITDALVKILLLVRRKKPSFFERWKLSQSRFQRTWKPSTQSKIRLCKFKLFFATPKHLPLISLRVMWPKNYFRKPGWSR